MPQIHYPLKEVTKHDKDFVNHKFNGRTPFVSTLLLKIYVATNILELPTETRYISFIIFYRYLHHYQIQYNSSVNSDRSKEEFLSNPPNHLGKIAAATLFLACKISNENRRIRDVINIHQMLQFSTCIDDKINEEKNLMRIQFCNTPPHLEKKYWQFKEEIVTIEHHLLRVLNFDVFDVVISPYRIVVSISEEIITALFDGVTPGDLISDCLGTRRTAFSDVMKFAFMRLNDALFYIDAMALNNTELACGAIQLAIEEEELKEATKCSEKNMDSLWGKIHDYEWWEWVDIKFNDMTKAKLKIIEATNHLSQYFHETKQYNNINET